MTDKCGDAWASKIEGENIEEIQKPQKILGHCSVILDTKLNQSCTKIITSDRDEKIRVSCFPQGFIIQNYLLGHKEAVVTVELLRNEQFLLSIDIDGICKLWSLDGRLDNYKKNSCIQTNNLFDLLQLDSDSGLEGNSKESSKFEVYTMKVVESPNKDNSLCLALKITLYSKVPIFELNMRSYI